ncbi:hypothetical protein Bbelb_281950 [Branchiostoma belcheri]|nr:hypothetical protein Bbelb_281950 [Branchiostoma belcheri]
MHVSCPLGYWKWRGTCYNVVNDKKSFSNATTTCRKDGGTLFMPKDAETNAILLSLAGKQSHWIGLHDQHEEGHFEWLDGSALGAFNSWDRDSNEPDNIRNQDCVRWKVAKWHDRACNELKRFICQVVANKRELYDELNNWSTVHRMQLHPKKCKVLYLHFSRTVPPLPQLKIDDHPLQKVKVAKLLGLHLQADLRWDVHVDYMVKKGGTRLFLLRKLKTFRLSIEDLLTIYTSYVRPVCEYAVPAWHPGLTQAQCNQLERIQRRAVRTILGKNYTNYADACLLLDLETLERRRDHLCLTFAKKLLQSPDYRHWFPPRRGDISGRRGRYRLQTTFDPLLTSHVGKITCPQHLGQIAEDD